MAHHHKATVQASDHREYGKATISVLRDHDKDAESGNFQVGNHVDLLFKGVEGDVPVGLS